MFKRTRISRITRISMRDEYFLIRGEYHEFYHPDGIRAIAFATFGLYAISKEKPIRIDLRDLRFVLFWNSCSLKHTDKLYRTVPIAYGKQKWDITTGSYACIPPVGGHNCITAGERSEPAVVDYKRMNVSVPVGGPTTTNDSCLTRHVRGKATR